MGERAHGQVSQNGLRFFGTGAGQQDRVRIQIDDNAPGPNASVPCDVGAAGFTIEFWLRGLLADNGAPGSGGDQEFADDRWRAGNILVDRSVAASGPAAGWGVSVAGGFIRFGTSSAAGSSCTIEGNRNVLDGSWHHVACTRDSASGRKRILIDGIEDFASVSLLDTSDLSYPNDGVAGSSSPWNPYIVLAADKHDAGGSAFRGYLDELRIWSVARTAAQVPHDFDRAEALGAGGLVAAYRFEEGAGTSVGDTSGAGSPAGALIAGIPGNGQWVSRLLAIDNTAPLRSGPLPAGFEHSIVVDAPLTVPECLLPLPDGRILIGEGGGRVWLYENESLHPTPVVQLPCDASEGDKGLISMVADPDFQTNGHVYFYYTTIEPRCRVSRFTLSGNTIALASETLIWQNIQPTQPYHLGGGMAFGADGHLYIATGDLFITSAPQDLSVEHGKLLRVARDGSIPLDNPYVNTPGVPPTIYGAGWRNPFRAFYDGPRQRVLIGNVGGNTSDASEELNVAAWGANHGWPNQEGPDCSVGDCSGYTFPLWHYRHNDPDYYHFGEFQGAIIAGAAYTHTAFPPAYRDQLYMADFSNRWIRRLILDSAGEVVADPVFLAPPSAGTIVDLRLGADGALYFVTIGVVWTGQPTDAMALHRIRYVGTQNAQPVAVSAADPVQGAAPLLVQFDGGGSGDPDAGPNPLTFHWDFGDGQTSTDESPTHSYAQRGRYLARLAVSDGATSSAAPPIEITVGFPPVPVIELPLPGATYRAGEGVAFSGHATDAEDGLLPVESLSWRVLLRHGAHAHLELGPLDDVASGTFTISSSGHSPVNTAYQFELTAVDSDGISTSVVRTLAPDSAVLNIDTVPSGIPVMLDGEFINTPGQYISLIGFNHEVAAQPTFQSGGVTYVFQCWSDGGAANHSFAMPQGSTSRFATYQAQGPSSATVAVSSAARNAIWSAADGTTFADVADPLSLTMGIGASGPSELALSFELPVPAGSTVTGASLELTAAPASAGSPQFTIRAYAVDEVPPFIAGAGGPLSGLHPLTSAQAGWSPPALAAGELYVSPPIASLVQEVVDRPGWQAGGTFGVVFEPTGAPGELRRIRNFSSVPPRLVVQFTPPDQPVSCRLPGDVDSDGDVDLSDLARLLAVFGSCGPNPPFDPAADFNDDDCVGLPDLSVVLANFGT